MIASKHKAALLSLAAAGLLSTPVQAASVSGSMDLKVNMPEILVLYHFDEIEIDLSDAHASTAANDSDGHEVSETAASSISGTLGTPITAALSIAGDDVHTAASQTISVTLTDAWAVRSIANGDVTVAGSIQTATLANTTVATSVITVTNMSIASGTATGASVDLAPGWAVQKGDITFDLDMSAATHSGAYQSAATPADLTDTFLLTLTGI